MSHTVNVEEDLRCEYKSFLDDLSKSFRTNDISMFGDVPLRLREIANKLDETNEGRRHQTTINIPNLRK